MGWLHCVFSSALGFVGVPVAMLCYAHLECLVTWCEHCRCRVAGIELYSMVLLVFYSGIVLYR